MVDLPRVGFSVKISEAKQELCEAVYVVEADVSAVEAIVYIPANPLDLEPLTVLDEKTQKEKLAQRAKASNEAQERYNRSTINLKNTMKPLLIPVAGFLLEEGDKTSPPPTGKPKLIEIDKHTLFYNQIFTKKEHMDCWAEHPKHGAIIASVEQPASKDVLETRVLIKTKFEDQFTFVPGSSYPKKVLNELKTAVDKATFETPGFNISGLKWQEAKSANATRDIARMEQLLVPSAYKFGIIYQKDGQTTENDMFCNKTASNEFEEFINWIGERVKLQGWEGYRGGLDVKSNSTGTHSIFTKHEGISIMFHVAPLLPYTPNDKQQVEKKRHLGNDVLMLVFKDSDTQPFDPLCVTSEFNHVFIVISPDRVSKRPGTWYRISIATRDATKPTDPPLPASGTFEKNEISRHWILTKFINCERAAMHAPAFRDRLMRVKGQQIQSVVDSLKEKK